MDQDTAAALRAAIVGALRKGPLPYERLRAAVAARMQNFEPRAFARAVCSAVQLGAVRGGRDALDRRDVYELANPAAPLVPDFAALVAGLEMYTACGRHLRAEIGGDPMAPTIVFRGGSKGEHRIAASCSDRARAVAHWQGYTFGYSVADAA